MIFEPDLLHVLLPKVFRLVRWGPAEVSTFHLGGIFVECSRVDEQEDV